MSVTPVKRPHLRVTLLADYHRPIEEGPPPAESIAQVVQAIAQVQGVHPETSNAGQGLVHLLGGPVCTVLGGQPETAWVCIEHEVLLECPILHDLVRVSERTGVEASVRQRVAATVREFLSLWLTYPVAVEKWRLSGYECLSCLYEKGGQS